MNRGIRVMNEGVGVMVRGDGGDGGDGWREREGWRVLLLYVWLWGFVFVFV